MSWREEDCEAREEMEARLGSRGDVDICAEIVGVSQSYTNFLSTPPIFNSGF